MRRAFNGRLLLALAACYLVISINYGVRYTYALLAPEMMSCLSFSNQDLGAMVSCFLLGFVLTSFVTGPLIDRWGAKGTILTVFPLLGVGSILTGMTSSTVNGVLFSFIAGVSASAGWSPVMVWSQKLCPERRGLMVGIMETRTKLCPFLIALAIPRIVPLFSWRGVWSLLGVMALLSTPLASVAHEPKAGGQDLKVKEARSASMGVIFRDRCTWLVGISYALSAFAIMVHATFYKAYLSRSL